MIRKYIKGCTKKKPPKFVEIGSREVCEAIVKDC